MFNLTLIQDDYEQNIVHIKNITDPDITKDVMVQIKRNMIKRTIIKIADISLLILGATSIIPSFLG